VQKYNLHIFNLLFPLFFGWTNHILGFSKPTESCMMFHFQVPSRVRVMRDADNLGNSSVGEKLCKHKYSSYPYCYGEITTEMSGEAFCTIDIILEGCIV
jgi:hypothetical protein